MIQLHRDYLLVETPQGQIIPCSAELVSVELVGNTLGSCDPQLVREAAAAVLYYFRQDLDRQTITVAEFSSALEDALRALGVGSQAGKVDQQPEIRTMDLGQLVAVCGTSYELSFFPELREQLRASLSASPKVLRFHGLRGCVKGLIGAKRWSQRCQALNDQIVGYLRACLEEECPTSGCGLVIC